LKCVCVVEKVDYESDSPPQVYKVGVLTTKMLLFIEKVRGKVKWRAIRSQWLTIGMEREELEPREGGNTSSGVKYF